MSALAEHIPDRQFDQEDQPLFMVMGGEVHDPRGAEFVDLGARYMRGVYSTYDQAFQVWRGAAQATVDRAFIKYMIIRVR